MSNKQKLTISEDDMERLRHWFPKGSTAYTILRHCSASNMSREIGIVALLYEDGRIIDFHPNHSVARLLGLRQGKGDGLIIRGCGMDKGYEIVCRLSSTLHGDSYAISHRWL